MAIRLTDDPGAIDLDRVHGWLAGSYWSPGIARDLVARAIAGSHVVGAFEGDLQIGFARLITDHATFAWLADVFVDEAARGQGVGRAMVRFLHEHPDLQGLRRWMLVTRDAHPVYAALSWTALDAPERLMQRLPTAP